MPLCQGIAFVRFHCHMSKLKMKTRTSIAADESKLAAEHNPEQFLQQLNLSLQVGIPFFQVGQVGCSPVQGYELLVQRVRSNTC